MLRLGWALEAEVIRLRQSIEAQMCRRILEAIEVVLEEELTEALGTGHYGRGEDRRRYRDRHERRRITTAVGTETLSVPRGRVVADDRSGREFRCEALPRYARRAREVDEAILGAYLAGANTRRIRRALTPLLGEEPCPRAPCRGWLRGSRSSSTAGASATCRGSAMRSSSSMPST